MKSIDETGIFIAKSKPIAWGNVSYPYNNLSDRDFESLVYSVFKRKIEKNRLTGYNKVLLMQRVGDKGIDCLLLKNKNVIGIIQCKKNRLNLSDKIILKELIKINLHIIKKNSFNINLNDITYFIATSSGFTGKALELICNNEVYVESNIPAVDSMALSIIANTKAFKNFKYTKYRNSIIKKLQKISIEKISPQDLNLELNRYKDIAATFFEVKKVIAFSNDFEVWFKKWCQRH